jgi:hypothetical protein
VPCRTGSRILVSECHAEWLFHAEWNFNNDCFTPNEFE